MRKALQQRDGRRGEFSAAFERFGSKPAYKGPPIVTLLFVDVRDSADNIVADHLWFKTALCWERASLKPGDLVKFEARVMTYIKGYRGRRDDVEGGVSLDYCLKYPSNVRVQTTGDAKLDQLPLFQT